MPWALNRYGRALFRAGRIEEGNDALEQAAHMLRQHRPGSGYLATVLDLQAGGLTAVGRYREAEALLKEAAQIHAHLRDSPIYVNENLAAASQLLLAEGKPREAERTLEVFKTIDGPPGTLSLTWTRWSLARSDAALAQENPAQSLELARRVRTAVEHSAARGYFQIEEGQAALLEGKSLLGLERTVEAVPLLERAVELNLAVQDRDRSLALADAQVALGRGLARLGGRTRAHALLAQARSIHARHAQVGGQFTRPLHQLQAELR